MAKNNNTPTNSQIDKAMTLLEFPGQHIECKHQCKGECDRNIDLIYRADLVEAFETSINGLAELKKYREKYGPLESEA